MKPKFTLYTGSTWCKWCQLLEQILDDPRVVSILEQYDVERIDLIRNDPKLPEVKASGVTSLPTIILQKSENVRVFLSYPDGGTDELLQVLESFLIEGSYVIRDLTEEEERNQS